MRQMALAHGGLNRKLSLQAGGGMSALTRLLDRTRGCCPELSSKAVRHHAACQWSWSGRRVSRRQNTLDFREALIAAKMLDRLFERRDKAISDAGYLRMSGQILDATLVAAPKHIPWAGG